MKIVLDTNVLVSGIFFGAVVRVHAPGALEVEFVTAAGRTQMLETIRAADVRPISDAAGRVACYATFGYRS